MEEILMTITRKLSIIVMFMSLTYTPSTFPCQHQFQPDAANKKEQENEKLDFNRGRFLPIPVFITEPALGEGLGVALAYFHRVRENPKKLTLSSADSLLLTKEHKVPPPTISGVFAGATNNETKVVGFGHINSFREDRIRYTGVVVAADVNTKIYLTNLPVDFNLEGLIAYQDIKFRLGDSDWFLGAGLSYLDATNTFSLDLSKDVPGDIFSADITNIGLAGKLLWDRRDTSSMPTKGQLFDVAIWRYDSAIGGDFSYWNANLKVHSFHSLHEKFVFGLRVDYSATEGDAPFFAIPYVKMRGIPALRYQGDRVASFEMELRYNLSPNWIVTVFSGISSTDSDQLLIERKNGIGAFGIGVRRKIFEAQNVWFGFDVAKGPEEAAWYIQVGHGW